MTDKPKLARKRVELDLEDYACALHRKDPTLNWMKWEQLSEGSRDEYRLDAAIKHGLPTPRKRL